MRRIMNYLTVALLLGGTVLGAGCASQQLKFDSLSKRDRLRYAACRHNVSRNLCPDDPDCAIKSADFYAKEPPNARLQWLIDYGCPKDKILHVDETVRKSEREAIGMPSAK